MSLIRTKRETTATINGSKFKRIRILYTVHVAMTDFCFPGPVSVVSFSRTDLIHFAVSVTLVLMAGCTGVQVCDGRRRAQIASAFRESPGIDGIGKGETVTDSCSVYLQGSEMAGKVARALICLVCYLHSRAFVGCCTGRNQIESAGSSLTTQRQVDRFAPSHLLGLYHLVRFDLI
jgi:hypothetical protein